MAACRPLPIRHHHRHRRPLAGRACNNPGPAGKAGTVAYILKAETAGGGLQNGFGVEALAVVANPHAELVLVPGEADIDVGGFGVFEAILETFLDDAEKDDLAFFGNVVLGAFGGDGYFQQTGAADAQAFFFGGLADAEGADVAGVEAFGEIAQVADGAGDVFAGGHHGVMVDELGVAEAAELHFGQAEQLAYVVMDLLADMREGLFLHFEAGLHELLVKLGLHLLFLQGGLPATIVVVDQHHQEQNTKE